MTKHYIYTPDDSYEREDRAREEWYQRQYSKRVCPECLHRGGDHALGCPNEPDDFEESEASDD